jgi:hypothetical protein
MCEAGTATIPPWLDVSLWQCPEGKSFMGLVAGMMGFQEASQLRVGNVITETNIPVKTPATPQPVPSTSTEPSTSSQPPTRPPSPLSPNPKGYPYIPHRWTPDSRVDAGETSPPTQAYISAVTLAIRDVRQRSGMHDVTAREIVACQTSGCDQEVTIKFAELVASHVIAATARTSGRMHYAKKVVDLTENPFIVATFFDRLQRSPIGTLILRDNRPDVIDPQKALSAGMEFGNQLIYSTAYF